MMPSDSELNRTDEEIVETEKETLADEMAHIAETTALRREIAVKNAAIRHIRSKAESGSRDLYFSYTVGFTPEINTAFGRMTADDARGLIPYLESEGFVVTIFDSGYRIRW